MTGRSSLAAWLALVSCLSTCAGQAADAGKVFQVSGVVKEVAVENPLELVVEHEEIPGYMPAMVMPFRVKHADSLAALAVGDAVTFRLQVTETDHWIDTIQVRGKSPTNPAQPPIVDLRPVQKGESLPDGIFLDQNGSPFSLQEYRGKPFVLTFIYLSCPLPNYCPLLNQKFKAVQTLLKDDSRAPAEWQLLSITIDPERDTPQALAATALHLNADPAHWRFATGTLKDITTFTLRIGLNFWDERGVILHNLRTLVVDRTGKVRRIFADNEWTTETLIAELKLSAEPADSTSHSR